MVLPNIRTPASTGNRAPLAPFDELTCAPSFDGLQRVVATVDTVGWSDSQGGLTREQQARFRAHGMKVYLPRRYTFEDRHGKRRLSRPAVRLSKIGNHLDDLLDWLARRPARPNRFDVAYDLHFDSEAAMLRAAKRMRWHLVLDHAPHAQRIHYDLIDTALKDWRGSDQPARAAKSYPKDCTVLRIELKFFGPANIEAHVPHGLYSTDPRELLARHLRWLTFKPRLAQRMGYATVPIGLAQRLLHNPKTRKLTVTQPFSLNDVDLAWLRACARVS